MAMNAGDSVSVLGPSKFLGALKVIPSDMLNVVFGQRSPQALLLAVKHCADMAHSEYAMGICFIICSKRMFGWFNVMA